MVTRGPRALARVCIAAAAHLTIVGVPREIARKVLEIESRAILELVSRIDAAFDRAVEILHGCSGRVVVTGMGKSGLIGQKISATFSSTGTPSLFLHPAEAIHGDLGRIVKGDCVLAISHSGDTAERAPTVLVDAVGQRGDREQHAQEREHMEAVSLDRRLG